MISNWVGKVTWGINGVTGEAWLTATRYLWAVSYTHLDVYKRQGHTLCRRSFDRSGQWGDFHSFLDEIRMIVEDLSLIHILMALMMKTTIKMVKGYPNHNGTT